MPTTSFRALVSAAAVVAMSLLGGTMAGADGRQLPPDMPLPPWASTTTTAPPEPPTTAPPTTAAPAPQTAILPAPGSPAAAEPKAGTKIIAPGPPASTTTTANPGDPAPGPTIPPASLSDGQVADVLRSLQRSGASSTSALIQALRPLQNLGMTQQEALALGMGRFPVLGQTNWTDDWLDPRSGPPPHQHQGNDLFAAFDTPVRAPADGIVRFEDAGLGGKAAYVTGSDGNHYYMAHLNGFARDLASGSSVKQGRIVGYNGDSGNAKGGAPHVHFEIRPGGGASVNPKPILDSWVAEALAGAPGLIASFLPKAPDGSTSSAGVPQILVDTGLTRRFSAPSLPVPGRDGPSGDFNYAVLAPLTPPVLAPLFDRT